MWVFLSRRLRTWALLAVGVPVAGYVLEKVGEAVEARTGAPTSLSRPLRAGGGWLGERARGPVARRLQAGRTASGGVRRR